MKLAQALRESVVQKVDDDLQPAWLREIKTLLPAEPLSDAFLEDALGPLEIERRTRPLRLLALAGRREIAGYAAALAARVTDPETKLGYADVLTLCRDERGYKLLEEVYQACLDDPKNAPPSSWVYDALNEKGPGDTRAWEAKFKFAEMREVPRMLADAKHGRRVADFVFEVTLSEHGISCSAAAYRYRALESFLSFWWHQDPEKLVTVLEHRSRCRRRECGATYAEASHRKVPEGKVLVEGMASKLLLDRALFEEAACEFALTAISLQAEAGRPAPESLEARLRTVRARI